MTTTDVTDEKVTAGDDGAEKSSVSADGAGVARGGKTDTEVSRPPGSRLKIALAGLASLVVVLAVVVGILAWLLADSRSDVADAGQAREQTARAEQVALDYAVGAAEMNYGDLQGWQSRLVAGTSEEMAERLTRAAESMEQIIVPLQWVSTASPIAAKARMAEDGNLTVNAFVSVSTKNSQAPEGINSTAAYQLRIDPEDWTIVDVSDFSTALEPR